VGTVPDYTQIKIRKEFADVVQALIENGSLGYGSLAEFFTAAAREKVLQLRGRAHDVAGAELPGGAFVVSSSTPSSPPAPVSPSGPPPGVPAAVVDHPSTSPIAGPGPAGGLPATPKESPAPEVRVPRARDGDPHDHPSTTKSSGPSQPKVDEPSFFSPRIDPIREAASGSTAGPPPPVPAPARETRSRSVEGSTWTCGKCHVELPLDDREAHKKTCTAAAKPTTPPPAPAVKGVDVTRLEHYVREFADTSMAKQSPHDRKAYLIAAVQRGASIQGVPEPDDEAAVAFLSRMANRIPAIQRALGTDLGR